VRVVAEVSVPGGDPSVAPISYTFPEGIGDVELRSVTAVWTGGVGLVSIPRLSCVSRNQQTRWGVSSTAQQSSTPFRYTWSPEIGSVVGAIASGLSQSDQALPCPRQLVRGDTLTLDAEGADAGDDVADVIITYSYEAEVAQGGLRSR